MTPRQHRRAKPEPAADPRVEQVLERIREVRHFDFRNYKRPTLLRRIERRMGDRRCRTISEYLKMLDQEPAEFDALISAMLIKVTSFFRDQEIWDELSRRLLPRILAEKRSGEEIRVWCAGSATGEEAYSVAILLAEAMGAAFHTSEVKIFGTDLDDKAIAAARRAFYTPEQVAALPKKLLQSSFVEESGGYCVRKDIRRAVVFGVNNLVSDAPISRLDLLLCRNVFIYLDAQLQKRVLTRFHYALRHQGLLVLGKSELIPFAGKIFETVDLQRRIYRKDGKRNAAVVQERLVSLLEQETLSRAAGPEEPGHDHIDRFHRDALRSLRLPVIATGMDGTVLLWNEAAGALWRRAESEVVGKKLAALALPGLSGDLLIEKTAAVREGKSELEHAAGVLSRDEQRPLHLAIEVTALRDAAPEMAGLLYTVQDVTVFRTLEDDLRKANEERQSANEELQTINEELQSANEELETTNEELQSANEELQTTNEELQSTNEELEATNEELQATNAELDSTNRELAHRTDAMNTLTLVQRTIIRSLSSAVVVLDPEGRITVWNLGAERLLGVGEREAVGQLLWTLHMPALERPILQRIRKALAQKAPLRLDRVPYQLPNGLYGEAAVVAVPLVDNADALGSVVIFEDATRLATLNAELAALKAGDGKRQPRS